MGYSKKNYEYSKRNKRCTKCGKQDAHTLIGKSLCYECAEKKRVLSKKSYESEKEKIKVKNYKLYQERKDLGICVKCGKRKAEQSRVQCATCLHKQKERDTERLRKKGIMPKQVKKDLGLCLYCDSPVVDGYSYCEKCLSIRRKNMLHARKFKQKQSLEYLFAKKEVSNINK